MNDITQLTHAFYTVLESGKIKVDFFRFDGVRKEKVYNTIKGANYAVNSWQNQAIKAWEASGRPDNDEVLRYRLFNFTEV